MVEVMLKLVVAPALVGAATLAGRRWGERVGGVVSAFPAIVGPVLLVAALQHGTAFGGRAASGTLLGLVALSGFAVAYGRFARHTGWRLSLAAGWGAAAVLGLMVGAFAPGPLAGICAATASLGAAHRALRTDRSAAGVPRAATSPAKRAGAARGAAAPASGARAARPGLPAAPRLPSVPSWDLPLRMALTAILVVVLTSAASRFGAVVGGVLAALPVLASVLAAFTHARCGAAAVGDLLRGMLAGMAGFVTFCALVAVLIEPAGIAVAFTTATTAALALQVATARARGGRRTPATAAANADAAMVAATDAATAAAFPELAPAAPPRASAPQRARRRAARTRSRGQLRAKPALSPASDQQRSV